MRCVFVSQIFACTWLVAIDKCKCIRWGGMARISSRLLTFIYHYIPPPDFIPKAISALLIWLVVILEFLLLHCQRCLRPSWAGGKLTPEGHPGWNTVWGLGGKTLNTWRIQLWHCCYCDMWQIQICTYSDVDIKCSSITDSQSLKLSTVYSSLFVDFHKLLGHLFRRHLVYSSFVYHTVLMQMQLWIVLQKGAFLCPCTTRAAGASLQFRRPCTLLPTCIICVIPVIAF